MKFFFLKLRLSSLYFLITDLGQSHAQSHDPETGADEGADLAPEGIHDLIGRGQGPEGGGHVQDRIPKHQDGDPGQGQGHVEGEGQDQGLCFNDCYLRSWHNRSWELIDHHFLRLFVYFGEFYFMFAISLSFLRE